MLIYNTNDFSCRKSISRGNMGKVKSLERHYNKWGYLFAVPFILAFLIFHLWPMANTVLYAFCDLKHTTLVDNPELLTSKGLPWYKNFADLFATATFKSALKNTAIFWIAQTIPEWALAFWLAAMMTDRKLKMKGRNLFKTAFFFPSLMSGSTMGFMVLSHLVGFIVTTINFILVAAAIDGFGVTDKDFEFFLSEQFLIIVLSIFVHFGITFIYAIAGMTSIPVEIFEAAEIDGSSRLHTFFHITIPCMRPIMFFIVVLTVVDGLAMSEIPGMLGNPFDSLRRTITLMMFLQNIFSFGNAYDRASAFCLVLFAISVTLSGIIYFFLIRDKHDAKLKRLIRKEKREERRLAAGRSGK